jgi:serine protease Do
VVHVGIPDSLQGLPLKNTSEVLIGEEAYAVGAPVLAEGLSWTLTRGIISQVRSGSPEHIQTDTPINPGNSGGPLTDQEGRVVGIVDWKIAGESTEGLAFAIASDDVRAFLDEVMPK